MATNNSADYGPTQYNVQVGGASGTLTSVAPSSTSGVPLISGGSSANPSFGTAVVAGGGTGLTSTTAYSVLCGGTTSTGALQSVASVGTTGQVLTSNGSSALPTFQNSTDSTVTKLLTLTASSSASLAFTSTYITTTYPIYMIQFNQVLPATNSTSFEMTFSTNNGTSYLSSNYQGGTVTWTTGPSGSNNTQTSYAAISPSSLVSSTYGLSGVIYLYGLATSAGTAPTWTGNISAMTTFGFTGGSNTGSSNVNNIKFAFSSGNIASGTITLYGIAQ